MSEENKAVVRRFLKTMDEGKWDELRTMMAPDHRLHSALSPEPIDREGHLQMNMAFRYRHEVHDLIAEEDKVVVRGVVHLTQLKDFQGIPPSGKEMAVQFIDIVRLANGQNAEEWLSLDTLGMMQQLGVVPPPEQAKG